MTQNIAPRSSPASVDCVHAPCNLGPPCSHCWAGRLVLVEHLIAVRGNNDNENNDVCVVALAAVN